MNQLHLDEQEHRRRQTSACAGGSSTVINRGVKRSNGFDGRADVKSQGKLKRLRERVNKNADSPVTLDMDCALTTHDGLTVRSAGPTATTVPGHSSVVIG